MTGCAGLGKVPFNDPRVTVVGPLIKPEIKVTGVATRINSGGFMEVQVTGTNKASGYRNLEYKIDWIDRDGFTIKTILSRWTMFPAYASSTFNFAAVAPKDSASDFRITIRKKEK
ncbi:MAG: YcfL family protein [Desulfobacteraceae bacterium]|nr:YcfL family protein [Desulfobacteraceae bacterium]